VDEPPFQAEWMCEKGEEWSGTEIRFKLERRPSGTLVRFTHGGWQSETTISSPAIRPGAN